MNRRAFAYPYFIWAAMFTVVPLFLIVGFSFSDGHSQMTGANVLRVFEPIYLSVMKRSLVLAVVSTLLCLALGYPMAMIMARRGVRRKQTLLLLFVIPMWMNFLLRTYAWMTLLERKGLINSLLESLGLPGQNLLYTNAAVLLGMVYNFLPFMVLPIYSVLSRMDHSLLEAAGDLGANPARAFLRVTLPLSLPGVASGVTMVFMPALTTFVISRLLGGGQYTLVGNLIEQQFLTVGDWNFGSALALVMTVMVLISLLLLQRAEGREGGRAW